MADLPRFKLLFLPLLAYEAIVQKMNVREQYKLATLSRRMQSGVCKSNRVGVVICTVRFYGDTLFFVVAHERTRSKFTYRFRPIQGDEFLIMKDQIVFLKDSLRLPAVGLEFAPDSPVKIEYDVISFLKQEKLRIRDIVVFANDEYHDESFEYLLNEGKDCRKLELYMDISPNFRTSQCPVLSVDTFCSTPDDWITVDHLLTNFMNCKYIYLRGCQFTSSQLNPFIKKWTDGSRIEYFTCDMNDGAPQFESIVNGIDATEIRQAFTRRGRQSFQPNECFLIKQFSGIKVLLYVQERKVFLQTKFSLDSPFVESPGYTLTYSNDEDEQPRN